MEGESPTLNTLNTFHVVPLSRKDVYNQQDMLNNHSNTCISQGHLSAYFSNQCSILLFDLYNRVTYITVNQLLSDKCVRTQILQFYMVGEI